MNSSRFWIGAAVGAVVAWYFFTPHGSNGSAVPGIGGPARRQRPRGRAGYSGFGRWV